MENRKVSVAEVVADPDLQARAAVSQEAVDEYAEAVRGGAEFPPLRVCVVAGQMLLVDGYHRHAAYLTTGLQWCRVEIMPGGTRKDAAWLALGANTDHGIRRTNADKRRAIRLALLHHPDKSHLAIAKHVRVSDKTVSSVWVEMEAERRSEIRTSPEIVNDSAEPVVRKDSLGRLQPAAKPDRQKESSNQNDGPPPEWTPPPPRKVKPETRQPVTPMPDGAPLLAAADVLRAARLRLGELLPDDHLGRLAPLLQREEGRLRADVPVICSECHGAGCPGCGKRGWRTLGNDRTEVNRARS